MKTFKIKSLSKLIAITLLIFLIIFLVHKASDLLYDQQILSSLEKTKTITQDTINKNQDLSEANKLFEFPDDQTGTFGIIKDIKLLRNKNPLFANAQAGDILIIYNNWTIIYDPGIKTIISLTKTGLLKP